MKKANYILSLMLLIFLSVNQGVGATGLKSDTSVRYSFVQASGTWQINQMEIFDYDANGNKVKSVSKTWNGFSCENERQLVWTYNEKKQITATLIQSWNGKEWINNIQTIWTYSKGNQMEILNQKWNGKDWVNNYRVSSAFNSDGLISNGKETYSYWNGKEWVTDLLSLSKKYEISMSFFLANKQ